MSREYFIRQNVDFRNVHNPPKNIRIYVIRKGQKRREVLYFETETPACLDA